MDLGVQADRDGVVSDQEAHEYLNRELFALTTLDEEQWREKPLAVLKRNEQSET